MLSGPFEAALGAASIDEIERTSAAAGPSDHALEPGLDGRSALALVGGHARASVHPPAATGPIAVETTTWCGGRCLRSPRRAEAGHEVKAINCLPLRMGWKSLYEEIKAFKPHVIGCGGIMRSTPTRR